jgi:hypothetical protein
MKQREEINNIYCVKYCRKGYYSFVKYPTGLSDIVSSDITLFGSFSGGHSDERFVSTGYRLDLWIEPGKGKNNTLETGNA